MHIAMISSTCEFDAFDRHIEMYAPQTKILEGFKKDDMQIFEAFFNG